MRRLILLGLTIASFVGCSLEDALENAPCESDDDCTGNQACVRTQHQTVTQDLGWCRSDGKCAAGEQEGCLAAGGSCTAYTLYAVSHASGNVYCCETGGVADPSVIPSDDGTSAQCVACPSDLCTEGDATEACGEGDSRCVVVEGTACGCRVPAAEIENSECDDDATCGEGFVCVRTLEQQMEPQETEVEDQLQDPGWCRPTDALECASELQPGCKSESSCDSGQQRRCAGTRCYCCENPSNPDAYNVHVYEQTDFGESAACIACPDEPCLATTTATCTVLEDATCVPTGSGPCGCLPAA